MMSKLQLSDGTVVILDETKLAPGQVRFVRRVFVGMYVAVGRCGRRCCERF